MQKILSLETNKYEIKIKNFEGPLDLLCHLIDKNKMDIYDINISEITEQYVNYLNEMEKLNLEIASEFLVMASTLLYLKSKNMLPKQDEEEKEITEEELIKRIIDYKKYKEITIKLMELYEIAGTRVFKLKEKIDLPKQEIEIDYNKEIIADLYSQLVNRNKEKVNQNAKNIEKIAVIDNYTVGSKVKEMYRALIKQKRFVFNKLFSLKKHNKQEVVTAFTGMLEMSKRSKVTTKQERIFGDIMVEKRKR